MEIHESGEMYLETILILSKKDNHVRSIDIVNQLGYSKASVSRAVSLLKKGGFLEILSNGKIQLTNDGLAIAERIFERHQYLTKFLMEIGVDEGSAATDACRIEHVISEKSFEKIKSKVKKI